MATQAKTVSSPLIRHQVREGLQDMIVTGQRPPGAKLCQQELAEHFGVAQGVVREALLELGAYGLVEVIDNRGVFVSKIDKRKLLESFEVREMHEGLAARLCCETVTRTQLKPLFEMVEEIYALSKMKKLEEMASLDRQLHTTITELSGNSMLIRLAHNYKVLGKFVRADRDARLVRGEHIAILEAIESGRTNDAERLMREHVAEGRRAVEHSIKTGSFKPNWVL